MSKNIQIVKNILHGTLTGKIKWSSHEMRDFNTDGIPIIYDLYWGKLENGNIVCLANEYKFSTKDPKLGYDGFLIIGDDKEYISSIIKYPTLMDYGHVSNYKLVEVIENEKLEKARDAKKASKRNRVLQSKLQEIHNAVKEIVSD